MTPPAELLKVKEGLFGTPSRAVLTALTVAVYALLFGIYVNNDIDDTWSTAWIYNFWNYGTTKDIVFREGDESYWGVRYFSHVYCYLYGGALSVMGYSKTSVHLVSLSLAALGVFLWTSCARAIFKDRDKTLTFLLLLAWSGVVFAAANKARSDAMVFCLMGLSLLLFIKKLRFLSVVAACVAVETHPIGGICFFYLLGYSIFYERDLLLFKDWRGVLSCSAGLLCGLGLYFALHHEGLGSLGSVLLSKTEGGSSNFLAAHFRGRNSFPWRYWPELLLFILAFAGNFAIYGRKRLFLPVLATLLVLSSFVFKRGNFHYAVFAYPAFLMLLVDSFAGVKFLKLRHLVALWLLLMLPQYLFLAWMNAGGRDFPDYVKSLKEAALPKDAAIYGMPSDWFALCDHPGFRSISSWRPGKECYVLEHRGTIYSQPGFNSSVAVPEGWSSEKVKSIPLRSGGSVEILKISPAPTGNG